MFQTFSQFSYTTKAWHYPDGSGKLRPKSDGHTRMVSSFCSRSFGLGIHVTDDELKEIIRIKRTRKHYVSKESAITVYGTTLKKKFVNKHLLIEYFDVGIQYQEYWTHDHMALQCEDMYDVMTYLYPNYELVIIMDQSTGHKNVHLTV